MDYLQDAWRTLPADAFYNETIPGYYADLSDSLSVWNPERVEQRFDFSKAPEDLRSLMGKYTHSYVDPTTKRLALMGLQQPGEHKYDVFSAYYNLDPNTGQYVLDTADEQRMKSTFSKLAKTIGPVLGAGAAAGLAGMAGAGAGTGAGTAGSAVGSGITQLTPAAIEAGLGTAGYGYNAAAAASGLFNPATIGAGAALPFAGETITSGLPSLNMATIESGLGTPGYGYNAAAEASGLFNPSTIGSGAALPFEAMTPNWGGDVVEIVDTKLPTEPPPTTPPPAAPPPLMTDESQIPLPEEPPYSNEGNNYPTPESTQGPGGSPVNSSIAPDSGIPWSRIGDIIAKNPTLAIPLINAVGKFFNKDTPAQTGPTGPGPQADFTKNAPTPYSRTVAAAPAGYRHGFEPEHRFFTGIGGLGA